MHSLIGICGGIGHGKDTMADYLVDQYGYTKLSMAYPLKSMVCELFNVPNRYVFGTQEQKSEAIPGLEEWTGRSLLEYFGSDVCRKINPDVWVEAMRREIVIQRSLNSGMNIVIPDIRFQNESDMIHDMGGTLVRVIRHGHTSVGTSHFSGQWFMTADADFTLEAKTVDGLYDIVDSALSLDHLI